MFFWNRRLNNVAGHNDGILELQLWILVMGSTGWPQLRHRPTALEDDHPLSSSLYLIEDSQAAGLEVRCFDGFHMTSIKNQSYRVNPKTQLSWSVSLKQVRSGAENPLHASCLSGCFSKPPYVV